MLRTILFLIASLCGFVYITYSLEVFDISFTEAQMNALVTMTKLYLGSCLYCFVISEIAENYSQVDKFWSTIPIVYVWYFTLASEMDSRMVVMAILVTIWGSRLTYNFARRGGFSIYFWKGEEDYRWVEVKKSMPILSGRMQWSVFNLFFICLYQMGLIFLFTLPILSAWQGSDTSLYWADYLITGLMLLLIVLETISDQQQYVFQNEKYKKIELGQSLEGDYKRGFITSGLWAYSRHPNYTCEQLIWITFYLFSISATGQWINWSIIGCILLVILFYSSAKFSENITSNKYTDYKKYQENTPMFIGSKNN